MNTIRSAFCILFALALLPATLQAASSDQAPVGPVHGRANSIDVRNFEIDGVFTGTEVTIDQKVVIPEGIADIGFVCPEKLVDILCTPEVFLGKCDLAFTSYAFFLDAHTFVYGTTTTCDPFDAGQCLEVTGRLLSTKEVPLLEDLVVVPDTCSYSL